VLPYRRVSTSVPLISFVPLTVVVRSGKGKISSDLSMLLPPFDKGAINELDLTNGSALIVVRAAGSVILTSTWFNHFDLFNTVTFGILRMLSRYAGFIGRSVESIAIF